MEDSNENFSNLQNVKNALALIQISMNISPEMRKVIQISQKIMSSPAYQAMIKQQGLLSRVIVPEPLMPEIQNTSNLFQTALQNTIPNNISQIGLSENFFNSALVVQNASVDFLTEMKKLDNYQQKTLGEILKELKLKKNSEVELPDDFPFELRESFKNLFESVKNFVDSNEKFISFIIELVIHCNSNSEFNFINYLSAIMLGIHALALNRDENSEQKYKNF